MFAPALSLILAALAGAAPLNEARQEVAVASVDRYAGPGCTGTVCNLAGSGDLYEGCNVVTGACTTSMKLSYANEGCSITIWTDSECSSVNFYANITSYNCYALGPPIGSISVDC